MSNRMMEALHSKRHKRDKPLVDAVRESIGGRSRLGYFELMLAVFPPDKYPRAWNYGSNGGPPGCAMALGAAIRRAGYKRSLDGTMVELSR